MPFMSDGQVTALQRYVANAQTGMAKARAKAEEKAGEVRDVMEVVGAAALIGFIRGKVEKGGERQFVIPKTSIDGELVLGLGLVGSSLMDLFGKYDQDVQNAGVGILAHYVGQVARNWGSKGEFGMVAGLGHGGPHGHVGAGDPLANALAAIV